MLAITPAGERPPTETETMERTTGISTETESLEINSVGIAVERYDAATVETEGYVVANVGVVAGAR